MIVKNEYVEIKMGNKSYIRRNMLMNDYLKRIFESQIDISHRTSEIYACYIKFDTPIENVDYDTNLTSLDFDVVFYSGGDEKNFKKISNREKSFVRVQYEFSAKGFFDYNEEHLSYSDFNIFVGKKITAIGFGNGYNVFAFLDVRNMNIVVNANEKMVISRVDLFQSDGICKGFEYPLHLVNDLAHYETEAKEIDGFDYTFETKAQLYSVGFGNNLGLMEEEILVEDAEVDRDDTSIAFNVNRIKKLGHYPSENLQLGFYPTVDNSKYLIFKYRLYRHGSDGTDTYLDKYYTMSMPNENFGNLNIKLKIERL